MQISKQIKPEIIAGAVGLLQPFVSELSTRNLVEALQAHGNHGVTGKKCPEFLTIQQAAEALQISKPTLYRLIKENKLPLLKASKRLSRIPAEAISDYLNAGGYSVGEVLK